MDFPQSAAPEISADERWQLIERILNCRELKRSVRLRELLSYLGKQSIRNNVATLHEQEIGEAVFGRSNDYDTSLDNIVRVNVTELRKRLSQYYEGEGAAETILVEIPRGAYLPIFSHRALKPAEQSQSVTPAGEASSSDPAPTGELSEPIQPTVRSRSFEHYFVAGAVVTVLLSIAAVFVLWRQNTELRSKVYPWQSNPVMRSFWSNFFESDGEVDIVTADTSLALAEDILKRQISLDDYLDYKYKDLAALPGLTAETRATIEQILSRNLGSVGDFSVAAQIMALEGRASGLRLANARAFAPDAMKTNNVILIGGPVSNPWIVLY